jgi:glutathione S-transferase
MKLYIGNKNYSSWSMRPWVLMRQLGIPFEEVKILFDGFGPESEFKRRITAVTPVGKVPVLVTGDGAGDLAIWDTLAITEYLHELFPAAGVWPGERKARARARSVVAEMHSGFGALRSAFPMNIEASLPHIGALAMRDNAAVRADVARVTALWEAALAEHPHPEGMLFGRFSAADAFYAPVVFRFKTYQPPGLSAAVLAYMQRVQALPGVAAWVADALAEADFRDFEEPYRLHR